MGQISPVISKALDAPMLSAAAAGGPSLFMQIMPLILIFVIFYFLLIRPQQKRARELQDMQNALKRGDRVITNGGLMGKVVRVRDDHVEVELAQGVTVRVLKVAIQSLQGRGAPAPANDRKKDKPKQIEDHTRTQLKEDKRKQLEHDQDEFEEDFDDDDAVTERDWDNIKKSDESRSERKDKDQE